METLELENQLKSKEFCIQDSASMTTLPTDHKLSGVGAKHLAAILASRFRDTGTKEFCGIEGCDENSVMVDIRDWYAGRADKTIARIVELALYFTEVHPLVHLATSRLNERLEFARKTEFLIMGPDEAFAVVLERENEPDSQMIAAFMTDDKGVPRTLDGIGHWGLNYHATPRDIASLNETSAKRAIEESTFSLLQEMAREKSSAVRIARLKETLDLLGKFEAPPERTSTGAIVKRWFIENGSGGSINKLTPHEKGWITYPTSQDAWYFSVVINPRTREIMTYAEGDVSHVTCEDQRQFVGELKSMAEFYGPSRKSSARAYDLGGGVTRFYDNLFFLSGRLGIFPFANDDMVEAGEEKAPLFGAFHLDHPIFAAMAGYPEIDFQVPADAFELDHLSPLAFEAYTCSALIHADGIDVTVRFASGKEVSGLYEAKEMEAV